ncbi:MAG TPA: proline--tRNA ligase [Pyrinomonadaceae bacterium]|jgi:prolyl-tRNA synthetase|nr:proline--tRNA ligase [Pyrinomonadaceae bacterium]
MRWSQYFIPTLREDPADAEAVSHRLLLRAGYIRQLGAGIYSFLPLGWRVAQRAMKIIREEMDAVGGQEFFLPALHPSEVWKESGRWAVMGETLFRLKDRKGAEMCLGMTHEEVFTSIARHEIRSYKQLPQVWYQIQTKFRDEERPKSGLMRLRQFTMKDAYTFDVDRTGLDASFEKQRGAYKKIFDRCGIKYHIVEASSGAMGGSESNEFMARTPAGEDFIAICESCGYAGNLEKATSRLPIVEDEAGPDAPEEFPTPGVRTIEDLTTFPGGAEASRQIKTLVYVATDAATQKQYPVLALLRGDHQLHEIKLADSLGASAVRAAHPEEIRELLGASAGSLGGVGARGKAVKSTFLAIADKPLLVGGQEYEELIPITSSLHIIADMSLKGRRNMTTGANKDDHHLRGVSVERDIKPDSWADLRTVQKGEACPNCDDGVLDIFKAMEIGHIFKLGTKYSDSMRATVLNAEGKEVPIVMGSYGIGVERILSAAIEQNHDADGIVWPRSIAPFDVVVTVTNVRQKELTDAGERLYEELRRAGLEVLLDDRDERAGVKFKDADLVGIPFRINVGKKIADGKVELFERASKQSTDIALADVSAKVQELALSGT